MTAITRVNIDALLDAGAIEICALADRWSLIVRFADDLDGDDDGGLFIPYRIVGMAEFGSITDYDFERGDGALPGDYYRVRADG